MRRSYSQQFKTSTPNLSEETEEIYAFVLPGSPPEWLRNAKGVQLSSTVCEITIDLFYLYRIDDLNLGFKQVCTVRANLNRLRGRLTKKIGPNGPYWKLYYVIGIRFGRTQLEAFLEWDEDVRNFWCSVQWVVVKISLQGEKCTSEATVIPHGLEY